MRGRWFAAGVLAAVGVLAWAVPSRAGDVVRLNGVGDAPARNLVDDGRGADTIRTWHRGFGWGWGGYRGFGWGWGGYGLGYRGFGWGGFYRPYFYNSYFYRPYFYRPFYGYGFGYGLGYGLGGFGLGYGLGGFGYGGFYPGFGIGYGGLFAPCAGTTANVYTLSIPTATLGTPLSGAPQPRSTDLNPPQAPRDDGTYPYDGGPKAPNTKEATPPAGTPRRTVPMEGRTVSLPKPAAKWAYPAYGETARRVPSPKDGTMLTRGEAKKPAAR